MDTCLAESTARVLRGNREPHMFAGVAAALGKTAPTYGDSSPLPCDSYRGTATEFGACPTIWSGACAATS